MPFELEYTKKDLSLTIKDKQKGEKKKTYSVSFRLKEKEGPGKSTACKDPLVIMAALDTIICEIDNLVIPYDFNDVFQEDPREIVQDKAERLLTDLLNANGRFYFPTRSVIHFQVETCIKGSKKIVLPFKTLHFRKRSN